MRSLRVKLADTFGFLIINVFLIYGFVMAAKGQDAFMDFLQEDGLVENLTAVFLFVSGIIGLVRAYQCWKSKTYKALLTWLVIAVMFIFAAGEEISWGQRIFNIQSSDFFIQNNIQKETNLHNLVVDNVKINMLVFSQLLFGVLIIYLLLLRPIATRVGFINRLLAGFNVPLARWYYVIALLVSALLISQIKLVKAGELYEFVFSVIFLLIFFNPFFIEKSKNIVNVLL